MGIADPRELAVRPCTIECRQLFNVAEFATIEHRRFNPVSTDRRRPESRLAQIEPKTLHALDLCGFH
ncbi:hypothetical protein D3C81_1842180 [compost metagenome]